LKVLRASARWDYGGALGVGVSMMSVTAFKKKSETEFLFAHLGIVLQIV